MTNEELDRIVAGLTPAQKRLLCGLITRPLRTAAYAQIRGALRRKGLWADIGYTDLGLAVRNRIRETAK